MVLRHSPFVVGEVKALHFEARANAISLTFHIAVIEAFLAPRSWVDQISTTLDLLLVLLTNRTARYTEDPEMCPSSGFVRAAIPPDHNVSRLGLCLNGLFSDIAALRCRLVGPCIRRGRPIFTTMDYWLFKRSIAVEVNFDRCADFSGPVPSLPVSW